MGALQPWHLIVVLIIALIVFGPGKLTGIGKDLGTSIRDFRKAVQDDSQQNAETQEQSAPVQTAQAHPAQPAQPAKPETGEVKPGGPTAV